MVLCLIFKSYLQNRSRLTEKENTLIFIKRESGWKRNKLGVGVTRYQLLYAKEISSKVLLYSTGNYIKYPSINHNTKHFDIY